MSEIEWISIFAKNLVNLLKENNMTQKQLSMTSGITSSRISEYVNGKTVPSVKTILKLAYTFDCSTDELIDFGDMIDG